MPSVFSLGRCLLTLCLSEKENRWEKALKQEHNSNTVQRLFVINFRVCLIVVTAFCPLQEIATALNCSKNIVPVTDHFEWPDPMSLPEDMRQVLKFNGIK